MRGLFVKTLAGGLLSIFMVSTTWATTTVTVDGVWWSSHSPEARFRVVEGILEGEQAASGVITIDICRHLNRRGHFSASQEASSCRLFFDAYFPKKFVVYMNDVSNFYADYPGALDARVADIIWCHRANVTPNWTHHCDLILDQVVTGH